MRNVTKEEDVCCVNRPSEFTALGTAAGGRTSFFSSTGNKMAGVREVGNNAVKVGNAQVRESKERGGTTCGPTFPPTAFCRAFSKPFPRHVCVSKG